eukprot:6325685-Amphidinium_carterae.1
MHTRTKESVQRVVDDCVPRSNMFQIDTRRQLLSRSHKAFQRVCSDGYGRPWLGAENVQTQPPGYQ